MTVTANAKTRAPISSHPVFPAIVALWFAALLGIGSMVLPVALLDKVVSATGLAAVLPAAEPPLGATARIIIALLAAGLGVAAGLAIARRVVAAQTLDQPRQHGPATARHTDLPAKRPISAREELGFEGIDPPVDAEHTRQPGRPGSTPLPGRRRSLAVTQEVGRSDFFESAPLPGVNTHNESEAAAEPLDLGDFAQPEYVAQDMTVFGSRSLSGPATLSAPAIRFSEVRHRITVEDERSEDDLAATGETYDRQAFAAPTADQDPPMTEFRPPERDEDPDRFATDVGADAASVVDATPDLAGRPLRDLGMVELVERFALSLQRRASAADSALELPQLKAAASAPLVPQSFAAPDPEVRPEPEPAVVQDSIPAMPQAAAANLAPVVPAALRPIGFDDDDDEEENEDSVEQFADHPLTIDLPARPFARPAPSTISAEKAEAEQIDEDIETGAADFDAAEGYSSLLAMKSPLGGGREFVRIDDEKDDEGESEPVVVFPGQQVRRVTPASDGPSRDPASQPLGFRPFDGPAPGQSVSRSDFANPAMPTMPAMKPADAGETERALRDALEKLQKMSGVA